MQNFRTLGQPFLGEKYVAEKENNHTQKWTLPSATTPYALCSDQQAQQIMQGSGTILKTENTHTDTRVP